MERQRSFSPIRPFELISWAYKVQTFWTLSVARM